MNMQLRYAASYRGDATVLRAGMWVGAGGGNGNKAILAPAHTRFAIKCYLTRAVRKSVRNTTGGDRGTIGRAHRLENTPAVCTVVARFRVGWRTLRGRVSVEFDAFAKGRLNYCRCKPYCVTMKGCNVFSHSSSVGSRDKVRRVNLRVESTCPPLLVNLFLLRSRPAGFRIFNFPHPDRDSVSPHVDQKT